MPTVAPDSLFTWLKWHEPLHDALGISQLAPDQRDDDSDVATPVFEFQQCSWRCDTPADAVSSSRQQAPAFTP